jgi:hypothetical protein
LRKPAVSRQIFGRNGLFGSRPAVYESTAARKELIKKLIKTGKFGLNREAFPVTPEELRRISGETN